MLETIFEEAPLPSRMPFEHVRGGLRDFFYGASSSVNPAGWVGPPLPRGSRPQGRGYPGRPKSQIFFPSRFSIFFLPERKIFRPKSGQTDIFGRSSEAKVSGAKKSVKPPPS